MSWSIEIECSVPAVRMFNVSIHGWHIHGSKILPEIIKSGSTIHVDGAVGSVRQTNFSSAMPFPYIKERLEFLDVKNMELKQSVIEGGHLGTKIESASTHFKFTPTGSGESCICKMIATYKVLPGVEPSEAEETKVKEEFIRVIKASEAFLLANTDVCV
ncbi:hypothetical protein J5N97_015377 [Dioscorea zingiberensis]|uniref:Bet v I/Major latex protein domain-containing protein n=1 Tax=Dioscorea zingiberensis TaxID=325984 RepID=A0A9D5CV76_9LILI|nr:hypothetical protein J5N97_015377 [Dioscorea zingiberensis]